MPPRRAPRGSIVRQRSNPIPPERKHHEQASPISAAPPQQPPGARAGAVSAGAPEASRWRWPASSFAALPGVALAASPRPIATSYNVSVNRNALASGTTVKVKVTVTSPEAKVKSWWSRAAVTAVVRKGVNGGRQSPYSSEGYRCTPVVRGETTSFTCKLTGADVSTTVRLTFAVIYRGDQASG